MLRARQFNDSTRSQAATMRGGLMLETAPIKMPPGSLIDSLNYEVLSTDGYRRIDGYERYDGQPSPDDAGYWVLNFDTCSVAINEGDMITGETSGSTGELLIDAVVESGSYGGGDAAGYLVITNLSGIFIDNETIMVVGVGDGFNYGFSNGFA